MEITDISDLLHPGKFAETLIKLAGKETTSVRTYFKRQFLRNVPSSLRFHRCIDVISKFSRSIETSYRNNESRKELITNIYLPVLTELLHWYLPVYLRELIQEKIIRPLQIEFTSTGAVDKDHIEGALNNLFGILVNDRLANIMKNNEALQESEILSADSHERKVSLEARILDVMEQVRPFIIERFPNFDEFYDYILLLIHERTFHSRIYEVHGLFVNQYYNRGEVRNIRVTILDASPSIEKEKVIYGFKTGEDEKGETLRRTVEMARTSAIHSLRKFIPDSPDYIVKIEIEGNPEDVFEGGSLGLAVALGIFAAGTNQQIGIETVGDLAVTGVISSENGDIGRVSGIQEKIKSALQAGIHHILLPDSNVSDAVDIPIAKLHPISKLEDIFTKKLLFDPWYGYLNVIGKLYDQIDIPQDIWQTIADPEHERLVVFRRFYTDRAKQAEGLARRFAESRLGESEIYAQRKLPVPILIDLADFSKDSRFIDVTARAVQNICERFGVYIPEPSIIDRDLQDGNVILIEVGLDDYEPEVLPFFMSGGASPNLNLTYPKSKQIIVCRESSWERRKDQIRNSTEFRALSLSGKRSTFLDRYIAESVDEEKGKTVQVLLPIEQNRIPASKFFYGDRERIPLYLDLYIQEKDQKGNRIGKICKLSEVIKSGNERRIILLGDGGAGKSTLLLKTFFDCVDENGDLANYGILPIIANLRELSKGRLETLEDLLKQTIGIRGDVRFDVEIENTSNLLIMFDGLNEISSSFGRESSNLSQLIKNFSASLEPQNWLIITSRSHDFIDEDNLLIQGLIEDSDFKIFEILPIEVKTAQSYLKSISPTLADNLWNTFGGRQSGIFQSPMLICLLSILSEDSLTDGTLTKSLIYKKAIDSWIKLQFGRTLRVFEPIEYRQTPSRLLKQIALNMAEESEKSLDETDLLRILEEIKESYPDQWPTELTQIGDREIAKLINTQVVLSELINGGLLRLIAKDRIGFLHDSIGHYLAGEALYDKIEENSLIDLLDQKVADRQEYQKWREPIGFLIGLLDAGEIDQLIQWCRGSHNGSRGTDFLSDYFVETERFDLMEKCAYDTSESIRMTAVRYIYYLWNKNYSRGMSVHDFGIIKSIASKVNGVDLIKNRNVAKAAIESCIYTSSLIVSKYADDEEVTNYFRDLWHEIIGKFLFLQKKNTSILGKVRTRANHILLKKIGVRVAKRALSSVRSGHLNARTFDVFFNISDEKRKQFLKILPYLDPRDKDINDIREEIFALAQVSNVLLWMTAFTPIYVKGISDFDQVLPLIEQLFDGNVVSKTCALKSLANIARYQKPLDKRVKELFFDNIKQYWKETKCRISLAEGNTAIESMLWAGVYMQESQGKIELWDELMKISEIKEDTEVLEHCIEEVTGIGLRGYILPALQTLESVFENKGIHNTLIRSLSKLRNYNRSEVEYFLMESGHTGRELLNEVLSYLAVDSTGDLFYDGIENFIQWMLIDQSDRAVNMRQWLVDLLRKGVHCKNMNAGLDLVADRLLSLISHI